MTLSSGPIFTYILCMLPPCIPLCSGLGERCECASRCIVIPAPGASVIEWGDEDPDGRGARGMSPERLPFINDWIKAPLCFITTMSVFMSTQKQNGQWFNTTHRLVHSRTLIQQRDINSTPHSRPAVARILSRGEINPSLGPPLFPSFASTHTKHTHYHFYEILPFHKPMIPDHVYLAVNCLTSRC
jgi:hypothetical protein